jgi:hypothetical protein
MGGAYSTYGINTDEQRVLIGESDGKRSLERPRLRLENNIILNLLEVGWSAWTGLIWLRIQTGSGLL